MQVRFTHLGCFIKEEGQIIAQGQREGRMFILDTNDVDTAMFAKARKLVAQADRPHELPKASQVANETSCVRFAKV